MAKICTLEGPFDYTDKNKLEKLSQMFDVNDALGQQVYGGRWPLVKRAACRIAVDAIDSPFVFQVRNLTKPEAVASDPVLSKIWGANDAAGEAILGRPCWNTLKGCLGITTDKTLSDYFDLAVAGSGLGKRVKQEAENLSKEQLKEVVANGLYLYQKMLSKFNSDYEQNKRSIPEWSGSENAVNTYFGVLASVQRPTGDLEAFAYDYAKAILTGVMIQKGWWNDIKKAAASRQAAVSASAAAQAEKGKAETYRGQPVSMEFYAMDTAKAAQESAQEAVERAAAEVATEEAAQGSGLGILIPIAAAAAALFAFS